MNFVENGIYIERRGGADVKSGRHGDQHVVLHECPQGCYLAGLREVGYTGELCVVLPLLFPGRKSGQRDVG